MGREAPPQTNEQVAEATTFEAEFGLKCLRSPEGDTSVIFVHGILSDGANAWGSPSWPELLLCEPQFRRVGTYVFGYRTSFSSRTYSIADAADALREHFSINDIWRTRRIVFVCHSMGGIVVRRFLVANQAKLVDLGSIIGLFLVASPSLGSRDANMLSLLSFALQHTQAAALRFSQSNTSLDELHRDFRTLLHGKRLRIFGRELLEDRPIKLKRYLGLWRQVVEPFSASAYFHEPGHEPLRIPDSDHSTIVKPQKATALQHEMLKRFLADLPAVEKSGRADEVPLPTAEANLDEQCSDAPKKEARARTAPAKNIANAFPRLDKVSENAIAPDHRSALRLLKRESTPQAVYKAAIGLRSGQMLERILGSALVKEYRDPLAVFMCSAEEHASGDQVERAAPWLRFVSKSGVDNSYIYRATEHLKLDDVDITRLKAKLAGWLGTSYLPVVDWDKKWCQEKFSFSFAEAYLRSAWRSQSAGDMHTIALQVVRCSNYNKKHYNSGIGFFHFVQWVQGLPKSNAKTLLSEFRRMEGVPEELMAALLVTLSDRPTADAVHDLQMLANHRSEELAEKAKEALGFIPARSGRLREIKKTLLKEGTAAFAAASGTDLATDCIEQLASMMKSENANRATFYAAWALCRLARTSKDARRYLEFGAIEHPAKLVRAICLIGLATDSCGETETAIADEYESALDMEKFCLSVALSYTAGPQEMLNLLATTSESRVYVPYMLPCFQSLFREAMHHAAQKSPILSKMISLQDDI